MAARKTTSTLRTASQAPAARKPAARKRSAALHVWRW
jgi:hypothetical protein